MLLSTHTRALIECVYKVRAANTYQLTWKGHAAVEKFHVVVEDDFSESSSTA